MKGNKKARTVTRAVAAVLMIAVLVCSIVYFWNQKEPAVPGTEVGNLCYSYELSRITADGISETDKVDPTKEGKLTFINFWGTWCTPCVAELPFFDQIATEYKDEISVFAVHSYMGIAAAPAYIGDKYADSDINFLADFSAGEDGYYTNLGGRGEWPRTLVIDENGVIVEIIVSALEYENLKEIVERELGK